MSTIVEALLNSCWQAAAVALAVCLGLKRAPRINAATRHAVWWAVLPVPLMLLLLNLPSPRPAAATGGFGVSGQSIADARGSDRGHDFSLDETTLPGGPRLPFELDAGAWPLVFCIAWSAVGLLQFGRIGWSYRHLRRVKHRSRPATGELRANFDAWLLACHIHRPVRLLISDTVGAPMAIGFLRPAVILPEALLAELAPPDVDPVLDHVLLHELAHIARHDDWTNLLAQLAGAVLALHPVAAWVLRQIARERELASDDWVVAATGAARPYAASLARLFELCSTQQPVLLASGIAERGSLLGHRIAMLLRRGREFTPQTSETSIARVAISAAVLLACVMACAHTPRWIAFAQQPAPAAPRPARAARASADPAPAFPAPQPAPQAAPQPAAASAKSSFLAALVAAGYGNLSVDEIVEMKVQGVSAEFLNAIGRTGWGKLPPRLIIELKIQGVRPEYVQQIHALGLGPYSPADVIQFKIHGVSLDLFRALKDAGFAQAEPSEITEAQIHGLRASHLREARNYGPNLTLKQIIRLKQAGVI